MSTTHERQHINALLVFNNKDLGDTVQIVLQTIGGYNVEQCSIAQFPAQLKKTYQLIMTESNMYTLDNKIHCQHLNTYLIKNPQASFGVIMTTDIPMLPETNQLSGLYQQINMNDEMYSQIRRFALNTGKLHEVISAYQECKIATRQESKFWLAFLLTLFGLFSLSIFMV